MGVGRRKGGGKKKKSDEGEKGKRKLIGSEFYLLSILMNATRKMGRGRKPEEEGGRGKTAAVRCLLGESKGGKRKNPIKKGRKGRDDFVSNYPHSTLLNYVL